MILTVHSNIGYLNKKNVRSRLGDHWFMSGDIEFSPNSSAILNIAQVIKQVMTSAAEAGLSRIYINTHKAVYIQKSSTRWATQNRKHHCKWTTPPQREYK